MESGTHTLRALIVDDEPPARRRLRKLLGPMIDEGRIHLVGEARDGVEALDVLEQEGVDLVFLDIQMPELDGFDVLERLRPQQRPIVIFTTAYDSYALRAFEASAVDYLLKPISRDRLTESVDRAQRTWQGKESRSIDGDKLAKLLAWIDAQDESSAGSGPVHVRQLSVPYHDRILLIPIEQIVSAEINEGITRIFAMDMVGPKPRLRQHVVNYTLDQLETMLPPERFMRVHRSAIVHIDEIQELIPWFSGRYKLVLTGNHEVIASRERSKHLKDTLMI
jgi:two-component system LytT family response regulator